MEQIGVSMPWFTPRTKTVIAASILALVTIFFAPKHSFACAALLATATVDQRVGQSWMQNNRALFNQKWQEMDERERLVVRTTWDLWARANQKLPQGEWQTWMVRAGRGFGKTRVGSETVRSWIREFDFVNIIAPTADDARDICVEGESGILAVCGNDDIKPTYRPSKRKIEWSNGASSLIFTADEPERLRGKQHMKLWCDELASWRYLRAAWDQAQLGLRLGSNPQSVVTTTPRPVDVVKELSKDPNTFLTLGSTYDNRENLAAAFYSRVITKYEGTRLGRQELNAELLEDRPGALWTYTLIDQARVKDEQLFWQRIFPRLSRIVGGIDPAVTSTEDSDECGIVFMGEMPWSIGAELGLDLCKVAGVEVPHYYVFDDRSNIYTPDGWAKAAIAGYHQFQADRLIGEVNNGGDMVESTIRHNDTNVSYRSVHASKGKITRAEPISALYEQGRVHHVGSFKELEDQMCDYVPATAEISPDRMDAMVWAGTELAENSMELGLISYEKQSGAAELQGRLKETVAEKAAPGKVTVQRDPAAVVHTGVPTCPQCQCTLLSIIGGGGTRCKMCGHQWNDGATNKAPFYAMRAQMLSGEVRRR